MLSHHTIDKLEAMGLSAMADGLRQQMEQAQYAELSFEERLGLLVDREATWRENRRLQTRLYAAKLRQSVTVEEIDFRAPRGLDRAVLLSLAEAGWVKAHHNLLLTGATGCGKSFVACALAHAAIRNGHAALYVRTPRLLSDLALARGDGRYPRLLNKLARTELLVLDDCLLTPISSEEAKDLLEIVEDRNQLRSTMVVSQLPVDSWHQAIPDPTLADAILDRLVQNAHRIALKGGSMRRRQPEANPVA
jgi:DNA replication protein DnaC